MAKEVVERLAGSGIASGSRDTSTLTYIIKHPSSGVLLLGLTTVAGSEVTSLMVAHREQPSLAPSQLLLLCARLNSRGLDHYYCVRSDGKLVAKRSLFYRESLNENRLLADIDNLVREFVSVQGLADHAERLPRSLFWEPRYEVEQVWRVVNYFALKKYEFHCDLEDFELTADIRLGSQGARQNYHTLTIRKDPYRNLDSPCIHFKLMHSGEGRLTKANLKELNRHLQALILREEVPMREIRVLRNSDFVKCTLFLLQRYIQLIAVIAEKGFIKDLKTPILAEKVKLEHTIEGDFTEFVELLATVFPSLSASPVRCPDSWRLPSFQVKSYKRASYFASVNEHFARLRRALALKCFCIPLHLVTVDRESLTVHADLSFYKRLSGFRAEGGVEDWESATVRELQQKQLQLIGDVEKLHLAEGYFVSQLQRSWLLQRFTKQSFLLPCPLEHNLTVFLANIENVAVPLLRECAKLEVYQQTITMENAMQILPESKFIDTVESADSLLFSVGSRSEKSILLSDFLTAKYWYYDVTEKLAGALKQRKSFSPIIVEKQTVSATEVYSRVPLPSVERYTKLSDLFFDLSQPSASALNLNDDAAYFKDLLECVYQYHSQNIAHLALIPPFVYCEKRKPLEFAAVVNFQFSDYQLKKNFFERVKFAESVAYIDYIDPCALSYLYWVYQREMFDPQVPFNPDTAKKKRDKYVQQLNTSCDVYSLGMLIYAYIWKKPQPFRDAREFEGISDYLQTPADNFPQALIMHYTHIIKPHRVPLISEAFEKEYPRFTDVLRRCFMRQVSRPKVEELLLFVGDFKKMKDFVTARRVPL